MRKLLACVVACLPFTAFAQAADPAPAPTSSPEWAEFETVHADAHAGPAVWRVARGEAEVWMLGTIGALPEKLDWNKTYVSELIDGARVMLRPAGASVGIGDGVWLLINYGNRLSLPRGQALEALMTPELRARFVALRTSLGQVENRYRTDSPFRAGIRIAADFRDKHRLRGQPGFADIADDKDVPVRPAGKQESAYDAIREILTLPVDKQMVCLDQMVAELDYQSRHAESAARAWAVGDIRATKANLSDRPDLMDCIGSMAGTLAALRARNSAATVQAIETALTQKGKTILLVDMRELLRKDGVLERLEKRGLIIEGPRD
jgi:uncharacterized protein YbaP (TraB family)